MALSRYEHTGAAPATGLASGIGSTDTTFTVNSGTGYPTGATGKFVVCIDAGTTSEEKILCSARSGTSFTVAASGRGYDGTTATSHSSGSTNVTHVLSAAEIDDTSDHIYTTTRDDHTQYARTDGTRAFTGTVTVNSGGAQVTGNSKVTGTFEATAATTLDSTLAVTGAATLSSTLAVTGAITGSSTVQGTAHAATLTGTTGRYVGATNGAPVTGTFLANDFANDPTNSCFWICTAGGTPGTWEQVGGTTDAAWTAPTFTNSWASAAAPIRAVGYRKINGLVYLRGALTSGTRGGTAFTLPTGYRPSGTVTAISIGNGAPSSMANNPPGIQIVSNGAVGVIDNNTPTSAEYFLDGISFDTL